MTKTQAEQELIDLIKDALRYREIRKHHNRGNPQPGIPFAMGWERNEDAALTGNTFYIREGELDWDLDEIIFGDDEDAPHPIDNVLDPILAALGLADE